MKQQNKRQLYSLLAVWVVVTLAVVAGLSSSNESLDPGRPSSGALSFQFVIGHQ
ncbi:MAG: hypothetical protein IT279_13435 [Ignavibacteriaceae bacterium]|nr:hypothetical protein [Ignavibacteriaceae bacterium]